MTKKIVNYEAEKYRRGLSSDISPKEVLLDTKSTLTNMNEAIDAVNQLLSEMHTKMRALQTGLENMEKESKN